MSQKDEITDIFKLLSWRHTERDVLTVFTTSTGEARMTRTHRYMGGFPGGKLVGIVKSGQIERRFVDAGIRGNLLISLSQRDAIAVPVAPILPRATTFHCIIVIFVR